MSISIFPTKNISGIKIKGRAIIRILFKTILLFISDKHKITARAKRAHCLNNLIINNNNLLLNRLKN